MKLDAVGWAILMAVPVIAYVLGRRGGQRGTVRGYYFASGQLSTINVVGTYFGANLTFTAIFLILSEEAYRRGVWVFSVPIFWMIGTVLFALAFPKLKPFTLESKTLHQALGEAFQSNALRKMASIWTIAAFVGTVGLEFYGGIRLLEWAGLPLFADLSIAMLLAFIVGAFTVVGGFRGVAIADRFLDVVALFTTAVIGYFAVSGYLTSPTISAAAHGATLSPHANSVGLLDNLLFTIGMAVIFLPFQFCTLDSWQRLGAWEKRGHRSPTSWLLAGGTLLALAYCVPVAVGITLAKQGGTVAVGSHPLAAFIEPLSLPPWLIGLVLSGFVAAIFSTADELLNCCSMSLLFDTFLIPRDKAVCNNSTEAKLVESGKFYTAVAGFVAAGIAMLGVKYGRQISELALAVFSTQVVFILPLFVALFAPLRAPRLSRAAMITMSVAFAVALVVVIAGWVAGDRTISDAAPVAAFLVALAVGLPAFIWSGRASSPASPLSARLSVRIADDE